MVYINANLDLNTFPKLDTQRINDILREISKEDIYVTFFARKENFAPRVHKKKNKYFLSVILPYEEVLENEDNLLLMLTHLHQNVDKLKWLDHQALKKKLAALLADESGANKPANQA